MGTLKTEEVALLIKKKLDDTITFEENLLLQQWADSSSGNRSFLDDLLTDDSIFKESLVFIQLEKSDNTPWEKQLETLTFAKIKADKMNRPTFERFFRPILPYVAAAIVLIFSYISYLRFKSSPLDRTNVSAIDVMPKEVKILLKTDKGLLLSLDPTKKGLKMLPHPTYLDGTPIKNFPKHYDSLYVDVPNSGDFKIEMEDGSKVWLNAASTLKMPKNFNKNERHVELSGEGFFEIAKASHMSGAYKPFLVKTNKQTVKVLGTTFNISSYKDEAIEKTTLIEGAVMLTAGKNKLFLSPGEQGRVAANYNLNKQSVYVDDIAGWRDNKFIFNNTDLQQTVLMLNRWYDIEITLDKNIPEMQFYGEISRDKNLSEVLKILEKSNLVFTLLSNNKLLLSYNKP